MFKTTPTIYGKDAERFMQRMKEADEGKHRISREEWERSKKIYDHLMKKSKCSCSPTAEATVSKAVQ